MVTKKTDSGVVWSHSYGHWTSTLSLTSHEGAAMYFGDNGKITPSVVRESGGSIRCVSK